MSTPCGPPDSVACPPGQVQGYECEVLKGAARLLRSHRVLALTAEIDPKLLGAHGCGLQALQALIQQDAWFNVTSRPTMSESTFFAHRCGALSCKKTQEICRMEMNGPRATLTI